MENRKTILVTGASSGIGKVTAQYFAERGWNVAATMRSPEKEKDLKSGPGLKLYKLDVLDDGSIESAIQSTIKDFGKIDALLNNAGYGARGPLEAATKDQVKRQFETNVFGLVSVIQHILPHFRENKGGVILNVSSLGGLVTMPLYSLYHGTKWCVEGLSESLSYELGPFNIRVKLIEPGRITTEFSGRSKEDLKKAGLTAYDRFIEAFEKAFMGTARASYGPEVVAQVIFQAANDMSPRLRYLASPDAKQIWFFRRWLGAGFLMKRIDKMIASGMKA